MDDQNQQQPVVDQGGMPQAPVQPEPQVPVEPVVEPVQPIEPVVPTPEPTAPVSDPASQMPAAEQPVQEPSQGGGTTL